MSKYTTEVRFICETYAGLTESADYTDVDDILNSAYPTIFDVENIPIFDTNYRAGLFKKILLHYYTREIGYETVGLWKLKLNQRMKEIMPYYNQLYESTLLEYNPLENVDNTHTHEGAYEDNKREHSTTNDNGTIVDDGTQDVMLRHKENTNDGTKTSTNTLDNTHEGDSWTTFSDTPQGALNGVQSENYLTNATHVTDTPSYVDNHTTTNQTEDSTLEYNKGNKDNDDYKDTTDTDNIRTTDMIQTYNKDIDNATGEDSYTNKEYGKIGTETYQEMVMKYRETFLNIDMMIIKELSDLFMKVW